MATPFTNAVPVSQIPTVGDVRIDALLGPLRWGAGTSPSPVELSFSFADTTSVWSLAAADYAPGTSNVDPGSGVFALDPVMRDAVRAALASWAAVANVRFVEVTETATDVGELRFAWTALDPDDQSRAFEPAATAKAGDVWLNALAPWGDGAAPGTYGYSTLLHEIGHALGLKHPFEGATVLPEQHDAYVNTLMTYNASVVSPGSWAEFEPTTPMLYDILALQAIYGANNAWRTGDDTYMFVQGQSYLQTLWDAGGNDTIVWEGSGESATIDLREGAVSDLGNALVYWDFAFSRSWTDDLSVGIAFGTSIENATGGDAADTLVGNDRPNVLTGRAGDDRLTGGVGNDVLDGGPGNDVLDGGIGLDTAVISGTFAAHAIGWTGTDWYIAPYPGQSDSGVDTLRSIENLRFDDRTVSLLDLVLGSTVAVDRTYAHVYRYFNTDNAQYFYTASEQERAYIPANFPQLRFEGEAFAAQDNWIDGYLPVYRFANLLTGGYFYTINPVERDIVLSDYTYLRYDSATFFAPNAWGEGVEAVYRLANLSNGAYLYTADTDERAAVLAGGGWRDDGFAFLSLDPAWAASQSAGDGLVL